MSLQDSLFAEDAEEDVQQFLKSDKRKRVLLFPPVNNYRRFLIHQLVQDRYGDLLQTFSIGQSYARRTVVCYKSDFIRPPGQVNGVSPQGSESDTWKRSSTMGIESQCTPTTSPEHTAQKPRQMKTTPTVEIYRPPAARRARLEKSPAAPLATEQTIPDPNMRAANRQKRPDRAVYVPRHRRSVPEIERNNPSPVQETKSRPSRESRRSSPRTAIVRTGKDQITATETNDSPIEKMVDQTVSKETLSTTDSPLEQLGEQAVSNETLMAVDSALNAIEIPVIPDEISALIDTESEKMESQVSHDKSTTTKTDIESEKLENIKQEDTTVAMCSDMDVTEEHEEREPDCLNDSDKRDRRKTIEESMDMAQSVSETENNNETDDKSKTALPTIVPETCDSTDLCKAETVSEEPKSMSSPQRLVNESYNDSNNDTVVKKTLVSDVLIITTKEETEKTDVKPVIPVVPMTPPEKKVKKVERPKSKPAPPPLPPSKLNRDECDWDSLFDDNGDCLDPTLIDELTSSVGEVVIEKPKNSYKTYTKSIEVSSDEFGHVIEIYNFPSDFKSSDLAAVFSPFKSGGFELKWVDDTHCLGVFSSPLVAAEVLASEHPFVKTRPLSEATALSKTKARRSSEFLQPYRTRPETCAALARRLVTKSLGVTLATARQEREQEKIVLREAKEKRRLANKQREDIWEGIISDKPTS